MIDTGDHVHHAPSGEDWLVARVEGNRLAPCGWPVSWASLSDCTLIRNATSDQRDALLLQLASCSNEHSGWAAELLKGLSL